MKKCETDIEVLKVQVKVLQDVTAYLISHHGVPFRKEHIEKLREICSGKHIFLEEGGPHGKG